MKETNKIIFSLFILTMAFWACKNEQTIFSPNSANTFLTITPDSFLNLSSDSSKYQIKILSLSNWEITEKPDWILFDTSKFIGMEKEIPLYFSVAPNTDKNKREGLIIFQNKSNETTQIKISQLGKSAEDSLSILGFLINTENIPDTVNFKGGNFDILVLCPNNWSIETSPSWITFNNTEYKGSASERKIPFKIELNTSSTREGEIILKTGTKKVSISVKQHAYGIGANIDEIIFDNSIVPARVYGLPERKVQLSTLYAGPFLLFVDDDCDWVEIKYSNSKIGYINTFWPEATIAFKDNLLPYKRTTNLYLKRIVDTTQISAIYKIEQEAATNFITINNIKETIEAPSKGKSYDLEVSASGDFQIQGNPSWVKIEKRTTNSSRVTPVTIIVDKNSANARNATISFILKDGSVKKDIIINQKRAFAQKYPINLEYGIILKLKMSNLTSESLVGANNKVGNYVNALVFNLPSYPEAYVITNNRFGFVIDAPSQNKTLLTPPIFSNYRLLSEYISTGLDVPCAKIYFPSYNGNASTFNFKIRLSYNLFDLYQFVYINNVPIPANLTEEDLVIYTIDVTDFISYDNLKYNITYTIE